MGETISLHVAVGEALEQAFPERLDELDGLLAYHYSRAELWDKTFQRANAAAQRAKRLYAMAEALAYYDLALAALDQLESSATESQQRALTLQRFDLLSERHGVSTRLGQFQRSHADLNEMVALARGLGDDARLSDALTGLGDFYFSTGPLSGAQAALEEALAVKRRLGDPRRLADSLNNIAGLYFGLGRVAEGRAAYHESHALYEAVGEPDGLARSEWMAGACFYNFVSDYEEAFKHLEGALKYCRLSGNRPLESGTLLILGAAHIIVGEYNTGQDFLQHALELVRELGDRPGEGWAWLYLSWADREQGDWALSQTRAEQALALARNMGEKYLGWYSMWSLARLALLQNQPAAALAYAQQMHQAIQGDMFWPQTSIWSLVSLAQASAAMGTYDQVQTWIETALAQLETLEGQGVSEVQGVYYYSYQALKQAGYSPTNSLLEKAQAALKARAATLADPARQTRYLTQVALNRAIAAT